MLFCSPSLEDLKTNFEESSILIRERELIEEIYPCQFRLDVSFLLKYDNKQQKDILTKLKQNIFYISDSQKNVFELLHQKLLNEKKTLGFVESCTGGMLSSKMIDFYGSSIYLKASLVAYDNHVKIKNCGVKKSTIENFGAVSRQCVIEMSENWAKQNKFNLVTAISGVAGPSGGSLVKPVGTVWIASVLFDFCDEKNKKINEILCKYSFSGNRNLIRKKATTMAAAQSLLVMQ